MAIEKALYTATATATGGRAGTAKSSDGVLDLALSTPKEDELDEVVDYDFIRRTIAERVSKGHIHLQETLCDDVLRLMLAHPRVRAAQVSTEKPDVYPDCDAVGCEVFGLKGL